MVDPTSQDTTPPAPTPAPVVYGIQETKDVLDLLLTVGKAAVEAEKDGKIGLTDLPLLVGILPKLGPALSGMDKVPGELEHLDESEAAELVAYVMAGLAVDDSKAKAIIAASLKMGAHLAVDTVALVSAIKS